VYSCCDDPLFGPVVFKNGQNGDFYQVVAYCSRLMSCIAITFAGSRLRMKNLGHNFG
jgi:hypothetical protein